VKNGASVVVRALVRAESQINLLARCYPANWLQLSRRLVDEWKRGMVRHPHFDFSPLPDLSALRHALGALETWAVGQGPWGQVWAERCRELALEAEMAEQAGSPTIRRLAERRFPVGASVESLRRLARRWACCEAERDRGDTIRSDDERHSESLVCSMRRELARNNWVFPVKFDDRLATRAVVDEQFVWIKPGILLRPIESKRIVVHEVHGHIARRAASRYADNWGYQCGFAGADADEEGRALWLEEQLGALNAARKAELGRRHLAADACRQGANFCETVQGLLGVDTPLEQALGVALRVWRGGGIAREIIYLGGYWRARRLLSDSLDVEAWMKRGRLSLDVATRLARGTLQPIAAA
jgi:hypothetical protein